MRRVKKRLVKVRFSEIIFIYFIENKIIFFYNEVDKVNLEFRICGGSV